MRKEELVLQIQSALASRLKQVKEDEWWYYCPFHSDEHASMHVNYSQGVWYCHACTPKGAEATLQGLARRLGILSTAANNEPFIKTAKDFEELIMLWHECLLANHQFLSYLRDKRALSVAVIKKAKLGLFTKGNKSLLTIPIADSEGKFVGVKVRRLELDSYGLKFSSEHPKYWWLKGDDHPLIPHIEKLPSLYPYHLLREVKSDAVYLCGGELDALVLWDRKKVAITSTKGETFITDEIISFVEGKTVFIALDNEAGVQERIPDIASELKSAAFAVYIIPPIAGLKDITDVTVANKLDEYLDNTRIIPADERANLWIEGGKYMSQGRSGSTPITSFVFRPHVFLVNIAQGGGYLVADIECFDGSVLKEQVLPLAIFDNAGIRQMWIAQQSTPHLTIYSHSQREWLWIKDKLAAITPTKAFTPILGLQRINGEWVFVTDTICVPERGLQSLDPENIQTTPFKTTYTSPVRPEVLKPVCDTVLRLHSRAVIVPLLAQFHAFLLAPFIRMQAQNQFPVTMVWGDAGVGKTTLIYSVFCPLIGLQPLPIIAAGQTESTLRKYTNMLASYPLIIDEFTPGRYSEEMLTNVKMLIHACFDMIIKQVSKGATALEKPYAARSPLLLIGERGYVITREQALVERVRLIRMQSRPSYENSVALRTWNALLREGIVSAYATTLVSWLMENIGQWDNWWSEAGEDLISLSEQLTEPLMFRQQFMWQVALFGLKIVSEFWKQIGCEQLLHSDDVGYLSPISLVSNPQNPLVAFLLATDHLAAIGKVQHFEHYKLKLHEKELTIAIHEVINVILKEMRGTEYANLTASYVRQFLENEARQGVGYVKQAYARVSIGGERKWCCVLDFAKLLEAYPDLVLGTLLGELYKTEKEREEEAGDEFNF